MFPPLQTIKAVAFINDQGSSLSGYDTAQQECAQCFLRRIPFDVLINTGGKNVNRDKVKQSFCFCQEKA